MLEENRTEGILMVTRCSSGPAGHQSVSASSQVPQGPVVVLALLSCAESQDSRRGGTSETILARLTPRLGGFCVS